MSLCPLCTMRSWSGYTSKLGCAAAWKEVYNNTERCTEEQGRKRSGGLHLHTRCPGPSLPLPTECSVPLVLLDGSAAAVFALGDRPPACSPKMRVPRDRVHSRQTPGPFHYVHLYSTYFWKHLLKKNTRLNVCILWSCHVFVSSGMQYLFNRHPGAKVNSMIKTPHAIGWCHPCDDVTLPNRCEGQRWCCATLRSRGWLLSVQSVVLCH